MILFDASWPYQHVSSIYRMLKFKFSFGTSFLIHQTLQLSELAIVIFISPLQHILDCHLLYIFSVLKKKSIQLLTVFFLSGSLSFYFFLEHSPFSPVCGAWHPSYPGSGDVRPGLIDQTINYPCITSPLLIACLTSRPRPYREKKRGEGWGVKQGGRESLQQIVN